MTENMHSLLENKQYSELKELLGTMHSADIAEAFSETENNTDTLRLFRLLPKDTAADVFSYLEPDVQQRLIESFSDSELRAILDDLFLDDCVDLIEEMPASVVRRVIENAPKSERALINRYLSFPENSAGSLMTSEYVWLRRGQTATEALRDIRRTGAEKETLDTCFIVSDDRKLIGTVLLKELVLADPDEPIEELKEEHIISVTTTEDRENVALMFSKYDVNVIPVVDHEGRLVGIITIDDAVDVLLEESSEDFEKMAGMAPSEESYLKTPVTTIAKNRILWLLILMISSMITGALLEYYEAAIATIPLLVSFIPMLMGTGGNCGTQASTMIIRGLALDEIGPKDFLKCLWKEVRVAVICGLILSFVNFVRIYLQYRDLGVAAVVCSTMLFVVIIAKSLGCLLPLLAKKLRLDPALMASPMLTTISDATSIFIFFRFAVWFLKDRL